MKIAQISAFLLCGITSSAAFAPSTSNSKFTALSAVPTPEESAAQLTAYMAKAHEEKIKLLKELEEKKNAEIKELKAKVESASSSSAVVAPAAASGDAAELSQKLAAYQKFMANYIVKAQEDKARAVREAEIAIAKKYQEKLNAFMLGPAEGSAPVEAKEEPKLFQERNAKIAAAAAVGKSRWGDAEVQKIGAKPPSANVMTAASTGTDSAGPTTDAAEKVAEADHGMRADGGVSGPSLAERVMNGAAVPVSVSTSNALFDMRNARIAAAEKAGKQTRWGGLEVSKAIEFANALPAAGATAPIVVTPEIEAADHGLRADGGVKGPSLAERVNLGAKILQ